MRQRRGVWSYRYLYWTTFCVVSMAGFFAWVATSGAPRVSAEGIAGLVMLGTLFGCLAGYATAETDPELQ